ncbi:MAG: hypothetical protein U0804_28605 [Gemmataceae bacterium]
MTTAITESEVPAAVWAAIEQGQRELAADVAADLAAKEALEKRLAQERLNFLGDIRGRLVADGLPSELGGYIEMPSERKAGTHRVVIQLPGCSPIYATLMLDSCDGLYWQGRDIAWETAPPGRCAAVRYPTFTRAAAVARLHAIGDVPF